MPTWRVLDALLMQCPLRRNRREVSMMDLFYIALTLGLFAISLAMIRMFGRM